MWYAIGAFSFLAVLGVILLVLDVHCSPVCPLCDHNLYTRRRLLSPIIRCEIHGVFIRRFSLRGK